MFERTPLDARHYRSDQAWLGAEQGLEMEIENWIVARDPVFPGTPNLLSICKIFMPAT